MDFIESQKLLYPELSEEYDLLGSLYEKKLWHQLSISLESFLSTPRHPHLVDLYTNLIYNNIDSRINQIKLAQLLSLVCRSLTDNTEQQLQLLDQALQSRTRLGPAASLCIDMDKVLVLLRDHNNNPNLDSAKDLLDSAKPHLSTTTTEAVVFSKFYLATAEYRKIVGPPQDFYSAALMFLAYSPVEALNDQDRYVLATDMALASVTGEQVFNFGEVLATPILGCLLGTPNEWLRELVLSLHAGDVDVFNRLVDSHRDRYFSQPVLASKHEQIKQKVVLLCLMNIAFERSSSDRLISFAVIADRARIPVDQVEWVLMRALSLGLIKGTIDQVEQVVSITWIQPRVLDKNQLSLLVEQLGLWTEKVKSSLITIEEHTPELYA